MKLSFANFNLFCGYTVEIGGAQWTSFRRYGRYPTCRLRLFPTGPPSRTSGNNLNKLFFLNFTYKIKIFDKQGTFRAFLASRVQNLDTIVRSSDREYPVVNLRVLILSWHSRVKAVQSWIDIRDTFALLFYGAGRSVIPHMERLVPRREGRRIRFHSSARHLQFQQPQHLQRHCLAAEGGLARSRTERRAPTGLLLRRLDFQRFKEPRSCRLADGIVTPTRQTLVARKVFVPEPICRLVHRSHQPRCWTSHQAQRGRTHHLRRALPSSSSIPLLGIFVSQLL